MSGTSSASRCMSIGTTIMASRPPRATRPKPGDPSMRSTGLPWISRGDRSFPVRLKYDAGVKTSGSDVMTPLAKNARIVGLWYLALVFIGPWRLVIIPNKLFVHDDAAATAANIAAHQTLFQWGIFVDTWGGAVLVFLTLAFWRLFKDVDRYQTQLLVITGGIIPGAIYFLNTVNDAAALILVRGGDWLNAFTEAQRDALAYFFTRLHFQVVVSAEVLWGIWLFPMGILILKSRWFPRV